MKARFPNVYVLDVVSDDHPGIVAAVTTAVESLDGNIDACSQTVLGGYFTLIMIVSTPHPVGSEDLAEQVRRAGTSNSPFQVLVRHALPPENLAGVRAVEGPDIAARLELVDDAGGSRIADLEAPLEERR